MDLRNQETWPDININIKPALKLRKTTTRKINTTIIKIIIMTPTTLIIKIIINIITMIKILTA